MVYVVHPTGELFLPGVISGDMYKKRVLAIPGSIRQGSSNHRLLQVIAGLMSDRLEITIYTGLAGLPHFDPGISEEAVSASVIDFRQQLQEADGVIICTPEYAHGVPGSLKNAIDWTVSSCDFSGKPTVLITASTDGRYGHQALLETLRVIEARDVDQLQLLIPFIRAKMNNQSGGLEEKTLAEVSTLMEIFVKKLCD